MQDNKIRENKDAVRLQVCLAHAGVASRRASESIIADGRVMVNGTVVREPSFKVLPEDMVCVDGSSIAAEEQKRYILLNKPAGVVCSLADEKNRTVAASLLKDSYSERLYNVGRLDMYSQGLIIFTNDGNFAAKISHPSFELEKEYEVEAVCTIPDFLPERFVRGVRVDETFYKAKAAQKISSRKMRIVLIEGKNHEIRNVMNSFSIRIKKLTRVRIGTITLSYPADSVYPGKILEPGEFRELSALEVNSFFTNSKNHD